MSRRLRGVGEAARLRLLSLFNELITFMAVVADSLYWLIDTLIGLYIWVIIIGAILSWLVAFDVVNTRNRIVYVIGDFTHRLTEPALRPIRRFVPNFGGVDISRLDVGNLKVEGSGIGSITLSGQAGTQNVVLEDTTDYDAEDLVSTAASIDHDGIGEAVLWVEQGLEVAIRDMGSVSYYGNPTVSSQITGQGRLIPLGER